MQAVILFTELSEDRCGLNFFAIGPVSFLFFGKYFSVNNINDDTLGNRMNSILLRIVDLYIWFCRNEHGNPPPGGSTSTVSQ